MQGSHPVLASQQTDQAGGSAVASAQSETVLRGAGLAATAQAGGADTSGGTPAPLDGSEIVAARKEKEMWEAEFAKMQHEFLEIKSEADSAEDTFFRFASEYKKVFRALERTQSHASELFVQFEEIQREFLSNVEQQADGVKALDHDQQTLRTLRQQIKRAEQMLEQSNKREDLAKNDLRQLKHDITSLTTTIKQGVGLSAVQERTINNLVAAKEQMTKELENELEKIVTLRNSLTEISESIKITENQKRDFEREIFSLKEKNVNKKMEIDTELRNKDRLDRELRELRVIVTVKSQEVQSKQDAVNRATEDIAVIENQIRQQKQMIEKLLRDQESLGTRTVKLQQDYDEQMSQTSQLMDENETAMNELKLKEKELASHKAEVKKVTRIKEALLKKNRLLEEQKIQAEMERKAIRSENDALMVAVDRLHRQVEVMKKNIDDLSREKDILSGNFLKAQSETQKLTNLVILQKQQRYNIELEVAQFRKETLEHTKEARRIEVERDEYIAEAARMQAQCVNGLHELKEQELKIFEFKRQMSQSEAKLKHQQNLYEAVQSERNLHSKHLIESQSEIAEMKRKLKIMNFQINGYKDDINSKEATLTRENEEHVKLKKDIDQIKDEIKKLKNQNELAQAYIRSQLAEEVKLDQFVKEAEVERARQENALQVLISERDNLSAQLIRRNDELTHVYDKIKTQQLALLRGELYYKEKLKIIAQLRGEIHETRQLSEMLAEATSGLDGMSKTIVRLQSEVMQEQMRVKALEQELENPINVHRWRKLEGSNPQAFDMIQLLHTLQKKLIVKNKEDKEKEEFIKVQEELYLHLKQMLAKQVGPEAIEQISELEAQLKQKHVQLRHMDTELNMYQAQVREYKYSIGQLDSLLAGYKKQFLELYRQRVELMRSGAAPQARIASKPDLVAQPGFPAASAASDASATAAASAEPKYLPMLPEKDTGAASLENVRNNASEVNAIEPHGLGSIPILEEAAEEEAIELVAESADGGKETK
ncbi:hypothetical protein HK105_209456 [Polyrhizophydium stewartii]|uniref:Cilia- and flagella-associated protein 58 central coiled coil domain-containing protein n=1 Tax=Polyrhizophydium stewartii TaxID=2732419 RepID=A0ABR4MUY5_9FUNG|nr:hypothetical protein HK105_004005 [Polyrhizophydium stewartii]